MSTTGFSLGFAAMVLSLLQGSPVPLRTLDQGPQSRIDEPQQITARTESEWSALWTRHAGDRARPAVDFSREMVVAVFAGSRPTAGFAVEIVSAREADGALLVHYRVKAPRPGAVTAQVLTSPYHIAAVPRHERVRFDQARD